MKDERKPGKVILMAVARKLLTIANAVLNQEAPALLTQGCQGRPAISFVTGAQERRS